jgi:CRISPR-associated protein Csx14
MNKISIRMDPVNPGHFYACCGLIELFDLLGAHTLSRFEVSPTRPRIAEFELRSEKQLDLRSLLGQLRQASFDLVDHSNNAVRPIRINLTSGELLLDWWFDSFRLKTTSVKCWAGQVTTEKLITELLRGIEPDTDSATLFSSSRMMTTRFGIDPRSAWNALDLGYSPNEHQQKNAKTYPAVEVLGAIGLQGFRPNAESRDSVEYRLWNRWLPRVPARRAALMGWPGIGCAKYKFAIEKRGSFKFFTFAASAERTQDHEF